MSGNTLFHPGRRRWRRPKQRAIPRLSFRTVKPDFRKAAWWAPGRVPHPISQGTLAAAGAPWPAFSFLGGNLVLEVAVPLQATGRASGIPVARGHLNSAEGTRDSYSGCGPRKRSLRPDFKMGFPPFAGSEPRDLPRG